MLSTVFVGCLWKGRLMRLLVNWLSSLITIICSRPILDKFANADWELSEALCKECPTSLSGMWNWGGSGVVVVVVVLLWTGQLLASKTGGTWNRPLKHAPRSSQRWRSGCVGRSPWGTVPKWPKISIIIWEFTRKKRNIVDVCIYSHTSYITKLAQYIQMSRASGLKTRKSRNLWHLTIKQTRNKTPWEWNAKR